MIFFFQRCRYNSLILISLFNFFSLSFLFSFFLNFLRILSNLASNLFQSTEFTLFYFKDHLRILFKIASNLFQPTEFNIFYFKDHLRILFKIASNLFQVYLFCNFFFLNNVDLEIICYWTITNWMYMKLYMYVREQQANVRIN